MTSEQALDLLRRHRLTPERAAELLLAHAPTTRREWVRAATRVIMAHFGHEGQHTDTTVKAVIEDVVSRVIDLERPAP